MDSSGRVPARSGQTSDQGGLSIDQRLALKTAISRLQREFQGVFDTATIERFLYTSHDQFTGDSAITRFLRAERFARQRLRALARVEGHHTIGKPVVLFLGVHNAGRSPMALGFVQHLAEDRAIAWSGGFAPGDEVNPAAVAAMQECDIDIAGEFPKPWTSEIVQAADVVVTMGCADACPVFPGKRYIDWDIDDPADLSLEVVRPIRDEINRRVHQLLDELGVSTRS